MRRTASLQMPTSTDPPSNRLLAALPDAEWQRWLPHLEAVDLTFGQVLNESGRSPTHAYFPTTAIVSLLHVMEKGASAAAAVVGNEGIVGTALFLGGMTTPSRAVVQSAGRAWRMQVVMTQDLIAHNLGVRREGVTEAALTLQRLGLIRCWRGHIRVLDRRGLERRACECDAAVRTEYDRLSPEPAFTSASAAGHVRLAAPAALTARTGDFDSPLLRRDRRDRRVEEFVSPQ
jgi:Crp-like helix-turn-helix domain